MPMYTLRTLQPFYSGPYHRQTSKWMSDLISKVLPPHTGLFGLPLSHEPLWKYKMLWNPDYDDVGQFPNLLEISRDILQISMALGGLSLRLPSSVADIAYASSCIDCVPALNQVASMLGLSFKEGMLAELPAVKRRVEDLLNLSENREFAHLEFWKDPEEGRASFEPRQHRITAYLNRVDISKIADKLKVYPPYYFAFMARIDKDQEHCSWPFNPKSRAAFHTPALLDDEYSRAVQLLSFYPITELRICSCGQVIDPAGYHLLNCSDVHFGYMHDMIKHRLASTIRALTNDVASPLAVRIEDKVNLHYPLREIGRPEGEELIADLVIAVFGLSQVEILIADVRSVLSREFNSKLDFHMALSTAAREKISKYNKYDIPPGSFHPLIVGRTGVLSRETLNFCGAISKFFPAQQRPLARLKAAIGSAITIGAARTFNMALRRLQLAALNRVPVAFINSFKSPLCSFDNGARVLRPSGVANEQTFLQHSLPSCFSARSLGVALTSIVEASSSDFGLAIRSRAGGV